MTTPLSSPTEATSAPAGSPSAPVSRRFIAAYMLGQLGLWAALLTPVTVSISLKISQIAPDTKAGSLSAVLSIGALLSMITTPIWGNLSDRTTSRFGRRRPWLAGGVLAGTAGLAVIALAGNVTLVAVGWGIAQMGFNASQAALNALLPDNVPEEQRGRVSGMVGFTSKVGTLIGTGLVALAGSGVAPMLLLPALFGIIMIGILVAVMPDRPADPGRLAPFRLTDIARSLWVNPFAHRDFGWAWAGRFLLYVGYAFFLTFQAYVITDHLGYSDSEAPDLIFYGTLAATAGGLFTAILGGRLSDHLQRRKIFVGVSAAVMGVGLLIIGLSASYAHFLVGGTVVGLGMGTYLAVDMALVARVLPNPDNAAKDLGVFQIANSLPQSLAPLIAPLFLSIGGGDQNYPAAFVAGTVFALLGALATAPIRGVR
ncbi:MFS transporter [Streptomyces sp. KM273126]|uniref:MFS transporter n=1 Tax=Streptomyces sp. KM273126 TaxID=2545247 RepID=UPI00103E0126|nr:MFS transporter [Streptomyces sp. KM273126]MBA2810956.1 MFS transporter [Streptomyces sp. KM273126]